MTKPGLEAVLPICFFVCSVLLLPVTTANGAPPLQYKCSSTSCTCIGTNDCKELLGSGWCKGTLNCGTDAGLPPDKCKCSVAKMAPKGTAPSSPKTRPGVGAQ
jgi:hypothetical protein